MLEHARDVVAEVRGDPRRPVRLMLPPGWYRVALRVDGRLYAGDVDLPSGADAVVDRRMLKEVGPEFASAKGGLPPPRNALFLDYAVVGRAPAGGAVSSEVGLSYQRNWARWSVGPRLSFGQASPDDMQIPYRLRRFTAGLYAFRRMAVGPVDLEVGPAAMLTYEDQQVVDGRTLTATVPGLAAALAVEIPLGSLFAMRLTWDAGAELVPIDSSTQVRPALRGALAIGVRR